MLTFDKEKNTYYVRVDDLDNIPTFDEIIKNFIKITEKDFQEHYVNNPNYYWKKIGCPKEE